MISGLENASTNPAATAPAPRRAVPRVSDAGRERIISAENAASSSPPTMAKAAVWRSMNPMINVMLSAATQQ